MYTLWFNTLQHYLHMISIPLGTCETPPALNQATITTDESTNHYTISIRIKPFM